MSDTHDINKEIVTFWLDKNTKDKLRDIASDNNRDLTKQITHIIKTWLKTYRREK